LGHDRASAQSLEILCFQGLTVKICRRLRVVFHKLLSALNLCAIAWWYGKPQISLFGDAKARRAARVKIE
jgi:hypothetical protein